MKKEKALKEVKDELWFLRDHTEWNNDKEVVLAAVQRWGNGLQYASDELKNDKDVVMAAVQQSGWVLEYASKELRNDKDVVMAAVQQDGMVLKYVSDELKNNKEVVLAAVQRWGNGLQYASNKLKKNKDVVLAAIVDHSNACQYSLLEGYQDFNEIVEKEGKDFLFSCWNNRIDDTRLQVAQHCNFLPTLEQIEIGLKDCNKEVKQIYEMRKDEWLAKIEENKLRNII